MTAGAEYLVGHVESGGVAAARLEVGGQIIERAAGDHIVVRAAAGATAVRVSPAVIIGESVDGRWGELAQHRLAALFHDAAPGDHVAVRITGAAVRPGDRVAVRVRRDGQTVVAERVACGADDATVMNALAHAEAADRASADHARREADASAARAERARTTPRPPWGRATPLLAFVTLGLAAIAASTASSWHGLVPHGSGSRLWVFAIGLGGATLIAWSARHDLPLVHRVGARPEPSSRQIVWCMQIAASLLALAIGFGTKKRGVRMELPEVGIYVACVFPALVALVGVIRAFTAVRGVAPVEQAARLAVPPPPRTWGVIEGVVTGSGVDPVLRAATTRVVQSGGSGRGGWVWEELAVTTTATPTFALDTGAWRAEVHTTGMTWAAPAAWQPLDGGRTHRAVAAVRAGDRVRVLARTGEAGDHALRAGGPESLFLVVGTPSTLMRRALRPPVVIAAYVALAIASTFS